MSLVKTELFLLAKKKTNAKLEIRLLHPKQYRNKRHNKVNLILEYYSSVKKKNQFDRFSGHSQEKKIIRVQKTTR